MIKTLTNQIELIGGPLCGNVVLWGCNDLRKFSYEVQGKEFAAYYKLEDGGKTAFFQRAESI